MLEMQKERKGVLSDTYSHITDVGYGIDQKISILWSQLTMCNPFDLLSTSMLKAVQFILQKENHKRRIKKTDQKCAAQKYEYIR